MLNYIILGMLYNCRLTGYDLKKHIENGMGTFYKASYGSIYPALKRLLGDGMVSVLEEQQGSRKKKIYDITDEGRQVFLNWLAEPIGLDEENGRHSHLARVYFFDVLPPEAVEQQLMEYEVRNTQYLRRLLALEKQFEAPDIHDKYYYKLSTLYYGIAILRETIRWCRYIREKRPFGEFFNERDTYGKNE